MTDIQSGIGHRKTNENSYDKERVLSCIQHILAHTEETTHVLFHRQLMEPTRHTYPCRKRRRSLLHKRCEGGMFVE